MRKFKLMLTIIMVILMMVMFLNNKSYALAGWSSEVHDTAQDLIEIDDDLDNFIKKYNIKNMNEKQIDDMVQEISFSSQQTKQNCISEANAILEHADKKIEEPDKKIEYLENKFRGLCKYNIKDDKASYLYYGYILGQKKVEIQNKDKNETNASENNKGEKDGVLGESSASANHSIDEIIGEAQSFMKKGDATTVNSEGLQEASNTVYNILLAVGIVLAVIIGIFLALKFMFSSVEDQAKVKESLIPYIVGCVVVFGAFIIWKLAIVILRGIS